MKIVHIIATLFLCLTFEIGQSEKPSVSTATTQAAVGGLVPVSAAAGATRRNTVAPQMVNKTPFAELLGIERISLAEPIQFRGRDGIRSETDFILIAVQLESFLRFTPRGIGPDEIMLNDEPVKYLWFPERNFALLAPVPFGPLDKAELWIAPFSRRKADTLERVQELRARASRQGPAQSLSLGPAIRAGLASTQIRRFANLKALQDHARDLMKRRAKPIRAIRG